MTLYCRRCDMTFCEKHQHVHEQFDPEHTHAVATEAPDGAISCSVCMGIVKDTSE